MRAGKRHDPRSGSRRQVVPRILGRSERAAPSGRTRPQRKDNHMNSFGRLFRVSIFGESHGPLVGVTLDGVPAGIALDEKSFEKDLNRRKSGKRGTTPRKESDLPEIATGLFRGRTTGAPLTVLFRNENPLGRLCHPRRPSPPLALRLGRRPQVRRLQRLPGRRTLLGTADARAGSGRRRSQEDSRSQGQDRKPDRRDRRL